MTIELPDQQVEFVRSAIAAGAFQSETEVVTTAIALLQVRQRNAADLRRELQPSLDRLARGEGQVVKDSELDAFFEDVIARGVARNARKEPA